MRYKWTLFLTIWYLVIVGVSATALAVDGAAGDKKGAHNQKIAGLKGPVCTYCHFSKTDKGEKIWATPPEGAQTLPQERGLKTVCGSCHYPGNVVNARSGFTLGRHEPDGHDYSHGNVLSDNSLLGIGESHVMSERVEVETDPNIGKLHTALQVEIDPNIGKLRTTLDSIFPLKESDAQEQGKEKSEVKGSYFTCTTCHNPHNQPNKDVSGNGDYLRIKEEKTAGQSDHRTAFCIQCHESTPQEWQHGVSVGCNQCHHPHDGYYQLSRQAQLGRSILTRKIEPVNFRALPNVVAFDSPPEGMDHDVPEEGTDQDVSALCYNCHGPNKEMQEAGATPIFGDDGQAPLDHHPMGTQAQLGTAARAPGLKSAALNSKGQVTCISCHDGFHRGTNKFFLLKDFSNDSSSLCTGCHTDKTATALGVPGMAHRQVCGQSPNKRGECMFCHFIHDGPDRGDQPEASTEALLRVEPVNLAWSDQSRDTDPEDFEDLCFGCHSSEVYMKGVGKQGAMLQPGEYFSHRFSSIPSERIQPTLPVSDGSLNGVVDDYGVEKGKIYCGSCHDVHHSGNAPYLQGKDSPYTGSGFCARCHTDRPLHGQSSHPVDVSAQPGITEFPETVYGGKSGVPRGITSDETADGQALCLTCHNVHAARTNFDGRIDLDGDSGQWEETGLGGHGKLLVMDNFSSPSGSDLCRSCHIPDRGIVGSLHDFSDLNLGSSPSTGVCSACHIPHGSPEETRLWARSLSEEREVFDQDEKPAYQRGVTLFCYDCHDDHYSADDDPPISSFLHPPQDIAFSDGPGQTSKVGFYETIPPGSRGENGVKNPPTTGTETGGHYVKTARLTEVTNGIDTGDKLPCSICHDPHKVNNNEVFLRDPLGVNSYAGLEASRHTRNGTGTGREICVSCHGYSESDRPISTPVRLFGVEILKTPSQDRIQLSAHTEDEDRTPCTDCHIHNRMAVPRSVQAGSTTHEFHFKNFMADAQGGSVAQRNLATSDNSERQCDICHSPDLPFSAGKLLFKDGKTLEETTVCDTCHSREGQYDGVNGYSYTISDQDHGAKDSWEKGVYEEVADENGSIVWKLREGKEAWCIGCHDDRPSRIQDPDLDNSLWVQAPNVAGDPGKSYGFYLSGHGLPKYGSYRQSNRTGASLICTDCHAPESAHIVNRKRERKQNYKNWQANNFRLKLHMELPRRSEEYYSSDFELCFSCHDEASIVGLPPGYKDYTKNHNPYMNLKTSEHPVTWYSNADERGVYPIRTMGRSIKINFDKLFLNNTYNLHWNHLALPNADLDPNAVITPQAQSSSSNNQRTQSCFSNRCHGGTNVNKLRPTSFWDSDRDGMLDSRPSCTACHNPHGSRYVSMTRNDLGITHNGPADDWYGIITNKQYGNYDNSLDNYNDLYCGECHGQLQRTGGSYIYYPRRLDRDRMSPEPPR